MLINNAQVRLLAMPRLIPPSDLSKNYVTYVREQVQTLVDDSSPFVESFPLKDLPEENIYCVRFSAAQGTWFTLDDNNIVNFLYHYQPIKLDGVVHASEALAYKWGISPFVMKDVFFDHMLPDLQFVVTDSEYTPQGARWFRNQYAFAFAKKLPVYLVDTQTQRITQITKAEFTEKLLAYWGTGERFTRWRFAISNHKIL